LFFPDEYLFPDPPLVLPVAFSVDHLGTVPVCDGLRLTGRCGLTCFVDMFMTTCCPSQWHLADGLFWRTVVPKETAVVVETSAMN